MRATLAAIAGRSAPASSLIVNYHAGHSGLLARLMLRLIGEAQISMWTKEEMAADLKSVGFVVREDSGIAEWNARFARGEARVERALYMRIAVGRHASDLPYGGVGLPAATASLQRDGGSM
jgi:hypothetical protein